MECEATFVIGSEFDEHVDRGSVALC